MTPEQIQKGIEHASQQNDRYLFVLMLAIVVGGGFLLIRRLLNSSDKLTNEAREDRIAFIGVVEKNTEAMNGIKGSLDQLTSEVRRGNV